MDNVIMDPSLWGNVSPSFFTTDLQNYLTLPSVIVRCKPVPEVKLFLLIYLQYV